MRYHIFGALLGYATLTLAMAMPQPTKSMSTVAVHEPPIVYDPLPSTVVTQAEHIQSSRTTRGPQVHDPPLDKEWTSKEDERQRSYHELIENWPAKPTEYDNPPLHKRGLIKDRSDSDGVSMTPMWPAPSKTGGDDYPFCRGWHCLADSNVKRDGGDKEEELPATSPCRIWGDGAPAVQTLPLCEHPWPEVPDPSPTRSSTPAWSEMFKTHTSTSTTMPGTGKDGTHVPGLAGTPTAAGLEKRVPTLPADPCNSFRLKAKILCNMVKPLFKKYPKSDSPNTLDYAQATSLSENEAKELSSYNELVTSGLAPSLRPLTTFTDNFAKRSAETTRHKTYSSFHHKNLNMPPGLEKREMTITGTRQPKSTDPDIFEERDILAPRSQQKKIDCEDPENAERKKCIKKANKASKKAAKSSRKAASKMDKSKGTRTTSTPSDYYSSSQTSYMAKSTFRPEYNLSTEAEESSPASTSDSGAEMLSRHDPSELPRRQHIRRSEQGKINCDNPKNAQKKKCRKKAAHSTLMSANEYSKAYGSSRKFTTPPMTPSPSKVSQNSSSTAAAMTTSSSSSSFIPAEASFSERYKTLTKVWRAEYPWPDIIKPDGTRVQCYLLLNDKGKKKKHCEEKELDKRKTAESFEDFLDSVWDTAEDLDETIEERIPPDDSPDAAADNTTSATDGQQEVKHRNFSEHSEELMDDVSDTAEDITDTLSDPFLANAAILVHSAADEQSEAGSIPTASPALEKRKGKKGKEVHTSTYTSMVVVTLTKTRTIYTSKACTPCPWYSPSIIVKNIPYIASTIGLDPTSTASSSTKVPSTLEKRWGNGGRVVTTTATNSYVLMYANGEPMTTVAKTVTHINGNGLLPAAVSHPPGYIPPPGPCDGKRRIGGWWKGGPCWPFKCCTNKLWF